MLNGILQSAVSGLSLNAQRVAASADNIANVSTAGYKRTDVNAGSLARGGVQAQPRLTADVQGLLSAQPSTTSLAVSGSGYFPVARAGSGEVLYTRDGSFAPDAQGNLVNASGDALLARPAEGGDLAPVNVSALSGTAQATTRLTVGANLPAGAQVGETVSISAQVSDSLGNAQTLQLNFTARADGSFDLSVPGARQGDAAGAAYDVNVRFGGDGLTQGFDVDGDGTIDSTTPPGIYIPASTSGAAAQTVALNASGLTRFAGPFTVGQVQADGAGYGTATGITVTEDGTLSVRFDNGQTRAVASIDLATFANPNALDPVGANAYRATDASGAPTYLGGGQGGAGTVQGGALELSTTDLGVEFTNLILAQSAYSASLRAVAAGDEMAQSLMNVRA